MSFRRAIPVLRQSLLTASKPRSFTTSSQLIPRLRTSGLQESRLAPLSFSRLHSTTFNLKAPDASSLNQENKPIKIEQRLSLTMTCTVPDCGERSTHEFTKRSYQKGIVIIQCPGCKNRHLIADHLGWFKETEGSGQTIEDIMKAKGETVRRGALGAQGDIEYYEDN